MEEPFLLRRMKNLMHKKMGKFESGFMEGGIGVVKLGAYSIRIVPGYVALSVRVH